MSIFARIRRWVGRVFVRVGLCVCLMALQIWYGANWVCVNHTQFALQPQSLPLTHTVKQSQFHPIRISMYVYIYCIDYIYVSQSSIWLHAMWPPPISIGWRLGVRTIIWMYNIVCGEMCMHWHWHNIFFFYKIIEINVLVFVFFYMHKHMLWVSEHTRHTITITSI